MGVRVELVQSLRLWEKGVDSLEREVNESGEQLGDLLHDAAPPVSDQVVAREELRQLLDILSPDERLALLYQFDIPIINDHGIDDAHMGKADTALIKVRRAASGLA